MFDSETQTNLFDRQPIKVVRESPTQKKTRIMDGMEIHRKTELEQLRSIARQRIHVWIYGQNAHNIPHTACFDDVREHERYEIKYNRQNNIAGLVFRPKVFIYLCRVCSRVKSNNGRFINLYTLDKYVHIARPIMESAINEQPRKFKH